MPSMSETRSSGALRIADQEPLAHVVVAAYLIQPGLASDLWTTRILSA